MDRHIMSVEQAENSSNNNYLDNETNSTQIKYNLLSCSVGVPVWKKQSVDCRKYREEKTTSKRSHNEPWVRNMGKNWHGNIWQPLD